MTYEVVKGSVVFGEKTYLPGDTFEPIGDRDWSRLEKKGVIKNVIIPSEPIKESTSGGVQKQATKRDSNKKSSDNS